MLLALTLHTAAHRGKRALTPAIIIECLGDGELAAATLFRAARCGLLRGSMACRALRLFFLVEVRNEFLDGGTRRRAIFVMATALCLFGSAGTGFLFGSLTGRFLGGAGFGSRTLAFAARIFLGKTPCFFFCPATILVLALTRAVERLGAGSHFFFGQRAQHDAGTRTSGLALLRGCSRLFRRGSSRGRGL